MSRSRIQDALESTDGRWAIASTTLTAMVAGAIAWLAIGTMPALHPQVGAAHIPLSYELFLKLMRAAGDNNLTRPDNGESDNAAPGIESRTITMDKGDTLAGILEDAGISAQDANAAIAALGKDFDPRALKVGQSFDLTYAVSPVIDATGGKPQKPKTTIVMVNRQPVVVPVDDEGDSGDADATPADSQPIARLLSVHFSPAIEQDVTVTRTTAGGFTAQTVKKQLQEHRHRAGARIDSSLYLAAMQAGIPADVVLDMMNNIFAYKVDFQRDIHPGDSFEVYYDYYYTPEGQPARYGAISYAMMTLGGKQIALYRYQPDPNEPAEYFDAKGESTKGILMKTPVDGARISSGFGSRFHPVLGYTRMHKGVDFAVPVGTPVKAAGAGVIQFMGAASGYGNFLKIDMGNGMGTGYAHLSRFAPGLRRGVRVRQGQIVAYSGNTGLTTGPHLHYEIYEHGTQVNPLTVKIAQGRTLTGRERNAFLELRLKTDATVLGMPLESKVSDISTDLRQAKAR